MKRDDGTFLALAAATALAAAAAVRRRRAGSPALEGMTVLDNRSRGARVSQPFKGLVGAASGGAAYKRYEKAFARAPFDLRVILSGKPINKPALWPHQDLYQPWVHELIRGGENLPYGTITFGQVLLGASTVGGSDRIERQRRTNPVGAAAIMSPFTVAHRLFDAVLTVQPIARDMTYSVSDDFRDGGDLSGSTKAKVYDYVRNGLRESAPIADEHRSYHHLYTEIFPEELEEDYNEDELYSELESRFDDEIGEVVEGLVDHMESVGRFITLDEQLHHLNYGLFDDFDEVPFPSFEGDEGPQRVHRLFASLVCPTAAGRKMLLADTSQAGAECFAMWCLSYSAEKGRGAVPAMTFSAEELQNFDPDSWAEKWYQRGSHHKKVTARKRDAYAEALRPYASFIRSMESRYPGSTELASEYSRDFAERVLPAMNGAVAMLKAYKVVVL